MENRSLSLLAGLIASLALPFAALAGDGGGDPERQAAWQERLDKAAAMQAESAARQAEAEKLLTQKYALCAKKFLVNDCRDAAYKEHLKTTEETRRLENDGKALEREVKKEQFSEREKQRVEDAQRRDADLPLRQVETASARRATDVKIAASRASKAAKAAKGEPRKAADTAKYQKRQAEHEARVARKIQQAEQRAAETAAKEQAKADAKAKK